MGTDKNIKLHIVTDIKSKPNNTYIYIKVVHLFRTMCEDMARIFEISLNKIEHSKSRKVYGKSNMLHRTLLVNTVINRVRNSDGTLEHRTESQTPFMNYRDPKSIDIEDYDTEKILSYTDCQTHSRSRINTNTPKKKVSSLVTLLNSRSTCGKVDEFTKRFA